MPIALPSNLSVDMLQHPLRLDRESPGTVRGRAEMKFSSRSRLATWPKRICREDCWERVIDLGNMCSY